MTEVTQFLSALEHGDPHAASRLLPPVYAELRKLATQRMVQEQPGADTPADRSGPQDAPPHSLFVTGDLLVLNDSWAVLLRVCG
jgi:hypothetical protein